MVLVEDSGLERVAKGEACWATFCARAKWEFVSPRNRFEEKPRHLEAPGLNLWIVVGVEVPTSSNVSICFVQVVTFAQQHCNKVTRCRRARPAISSSPLALERYIRTSRSRWQL